MRYRHKALRVPDAAERVATYDSDGNLLTKAGTATAPQTILINPDNASDVAEVDLDALDYPSGTRVVVEDINGATANEITVTPKGSFVDASGTAVTQVVIDTDDGYAILDIVGGLTVLSAYKGATLS